jgi:hypothetical protein
LQGKSQIENIGRHPHEQVRIEFSTANGILGAIYTVSSFFLNHAGEVILGKKIGNLNNCQPSANACEGEVKAQIMIEGLDKDEEAEGKGELIEHLNHNVQNSKLVVIAPHGGDIEQWTDVEADASRIIFRLIVFLYGYVRALVASPMANPMKMHLSVGISLQPKLVKNHSQCLTRLLGPILRSIIPSPFMGGWKIPFVLEAIHKIRTLT